MHAETSPSEGAPVADRSREGLTSAKLTQILRLLHPENTRTLARVARFEALDLDVIAEATGVRLRGLLVDVDDTLGPHHRPVPEPAHAHVERLLARGVRMAVYSNARADVNAERAADIARLSRLGVHVLGGDIPPKPDVRGFQRALDVLSLPAAEIAMVGDSYLTDGGAVRAGMHFIKVAPVSDRLGDSPKEALARLPNVVMRAAFDVLSRAQERLPGRIAAPRLG